MRRIARDALTAAARLIYPLGAQCMGCGLLCGFEGEWLCPECRMALAERWIGASPPPAGLEGAAYAYAYAGPAGGMVRNLKYRGVRRLAEVMCPDMVRAYGFLTPTGADLVVPVPMHRARLRQRGFNHAELLARGVAEAVGLPCENALLRARNTVQQARLSEAERRSNLDNAFGLIQDVRDRRVLLVDDVCTTGTTARACADTLRAGGAASVYLLCFARSKLEEEQEGVKS